MTAGESLSERDVWTRRYLEQMMVRFTTLGVPLVQAANELVEIEAHIAASECDPFDELGNPQTMASSLVSIEQRRSLYRRHLRRDVLWGIFFGTALSAGLQFVLSLFSLEATSAPKMLVFFVIACLFGVGQFSFATLAMGVSDDDETSTRLRGAAQASLWAIGAVAIFAIALAVVGADFSGERPVEFSSGVWAAVFIATTVAGGYAFWRTYRLKGQEEILIEGGVTGQIVYEMNHNGYLKGWIRYGPDGTDLRDPNYSLLGDLKSVLSDPLKDSP